MRLFTLITVFALTTGCHVALGLDDIDPGEANETSTTTGGANSTSNTAAGGSAQAGNGGGGTTNTTGGSGGAGGNPDPLFRGPAVGTYLLSGRLAGLESPEYYVTVTASGPDGVTLSSQPLHAQSRTPVGPATDYDEVPDVFADSTELFLGVVTAPAEANPVTPLAIAAQNVVLEFERSDPPCGTLSGDLVAPLMQDLAGSTFVMTPVASINDLPANPPGACP